MTGVLSWLQEYIAVSEAEWESIQSITEISTLKKNEMILKQGQVSTKIGLLLQGAVKTYFSDAQGNERVVGFSFEGQPLLLINSFIHQLPSSVSAITLEPSVIAWTDYKNYTAFIEQYPRYNQVLISAMIKWFAENKERMEYLNQPMAKDKYEKMCDLQPELLARVPLKYLASYLGIKQETLSRIRRKKAKSAKAV